jgi:phosphoribosylformylglycinamidine synthase
VQVGDPFTEKLLLEASLELIRSGHIVGIQDMGAAGLASSSSEMAARAGTGVDIDVAHMPVRESGMTPYEILLSESQERMLVVASAGHEAEVHRILEKWELESAVIGHVTDDGLYRVRENGVVVCEIPGEPLVACPTYIREGRESERIQRLRGWQPQDEHLQPARAHPGKVLLRLLASPTIASKRWVYNQYDTTVRTNTVLGPGGDAGVLRIRGSRRGIAMTVDCNGRYCLLNPARGAMIAVAEAARNIVCVGARPRAVTDNLNFGNPQKPEVYHQLREVVLAMGDACRAFNIPVVSGNVSLYNENPDGAIDPTPVIGMVGVLEDVSHFVGHAFRAAGDRIILLGRNTAELGASEYLKVVHGLVAGNAPAVDLAAERALQEAVIEMAETGLLRGAHDCAEGGLLVCLAESAIGSEDTGLAGVDVDLDDDIEPAPLLFGEAQGRIVISCALDAVPQVMSIAQKHGVPARTIGKVTALAHGPAVDAAPRFRVRAPDIAVDLPATALAEVYRTAIPRLMDRALTEH